jgi:DNA repair protein RecN (Recombination protein N)
VEALFAGLSATSHPDLAGIISLQGEVVVGRRLHETGRSSASINGRAVAVKELRAVCAALIEPHGQNEQYRLRDPESHVEYVDAFAGNRELTNAYALALARWREAGAELARFDAETARLRERSELFAHRLQEIDRLAPRAGEKAELETSARLMANAEKVFAAVEEACAVLYDSDGAAVARRRLSSIAALDKRLAAIEERLALAEAIISEAADEARSIRAQLEFEPADMERVQERLEALTRLERRYQSTIEKILDDRATWSRGLAGLEDAGENRAVLLETTRVRAEELASAGGALSSSRHRAAKALDKMVSGELEHLMIKGARFRTDITHVPNAESTVHVEGAGVSVFENGLDLVRMRVRTNPGEAEGALEDIASTGELSRIALVLKPLAAASGAGSTLIFDEIDAGVGADLGDALAEKLLALSQTHQIVCITHLPQIAARGDTHLVVLKETADNRTRVRVSAVDGDGRTREIARMLGGSEGSTQRIALARELLAGARTRRPASRVRP